MGDFFEQPVRELARQAVSLGQIDDFRIEAERLVVMKDGTEQVYDKGQARRLLQSMIRMHLRRAMGTPGDDPSPQA